jgi:DNA topoisomerase-1
MHLVIVESPAKAKTINKYLGTGYTVLASLGHVRDLREKDDAIEPQNGFAMHWEVNDDRAKRAIAELKKALKSAETVYLATDPDREGEAISWHLQELLQEAKHKKSPAFKRVVFNEITKAAVHAGMEAAHAIDPALVDAYRARRALDFLYGFTLSPVLWRRLPGSRSAGRVQSVALRLICEREAEIERFNAREYWTVEAAFANAVGAGFSARLTHLAGKKLDKFDLPDRASAEAAVVAIKAAAPFTVASVERKRVKRHPMPPFTTSTLQQEASRKLGLGASRTMRLAQQLYEGIELDGETVGLITYMRTDAVTLSREAIGAARTLIASQYGQPYLPEAARVYKTNAKNAQEAHEAIRPTDLARKPEALRRHLAPDLLKLYDLIWRRTLASQMESAVLDQVAVDLASGDRQVVLRATGSTLVFDGFLTLYREDRDEPAEDEDDRLLPPLNEGERTTLGEVKPEQHFTQPPPRYSEASLVKRLEELGIGRPSTYASIIDTLQDRQYVRLEKRRFIPEDRGWVVTSFLKSFFERYVEYDFTAELENQLDEVSGGRADWRAVLERFWRPFSRTEDQANLPSIKQAIDQLVRSVGSTREVIEAVDQSMAEHVFPARADGSDPRACPTCRKGRLGIKPSRTGAFIGCSNYPECRYTRPLGANDDAPALAAARTLGVDPTTSEVVSLRNGRFGLYLQLGEGAEDVKPRRVSLPRDIAPDAIDLDTALKLLALPREIGKHPESREPILAGLGRFGPYIKHQTRYVSLESSADLLSIGLNRAVDLLAQPPRRRGRGAPAGRPLGDHPEDGKPVTAGTGRFGPYVKHGSTYANLPKDMGVDQVTLEEAIELIRARRERQANAPAAPKAARKKAAKPKARKAKSDKAPAETGEER